MTLAVALCVAPGYTCVSSRRGKKDRAFSAMDQPLHTSMRAGLALAGGPPDDPGHDLALRNIEAVAAGAFFTAVEVSMLATPPWRRRVADLVRASRLSLVYDGATGLRALGLDLSSGDEIARGRALDAARRMLDEAGEMGAERVNVIGGAGQAPEQRDQADEALVDSLCALAGYSCERDGPVLALTSLPYPGSNGASAGPTQEEVSLVRLVREVYPEVSLTFDARNRTVLGDDMMASLTLAAPYLGQVTLGMPAHTGVDTPHQAGADGAGDVARLAGTLLTLFRARFLGAGRRPLILFHAAPHTGASFNATIDAAKRTLEEAWARL